MGRLLIIPLVLLLLLAGAVVWSGGSSEHPADFRFISVRDINTLDINQMSYLQDIRITYAIREGLYSYDGMTLEPIPAVATGFDLSADKRVYTFHLRPEVRWSNGDPVVAGDFLFAWKRMLDSPAEYTYLHYYIQGAEEYVTRGARGEPVDIKTVGIEAVDPHTFRVTLHDPVPFMLDLMAYTPFYPLHEKSMEKFKQVDAATGKVTYNQSFTRPPDVVTNGAFNLVAWDFRQRLRLEQNPFYWDKGNVKSRSIEMLVVEDALSQVLLYDAGKADWLSSVPSEVAPELLAVNRPDFHTFAGFGTEYLSLMVKPTFNNGQKNPLADMRIRHALAMTIDKDAIVKNITRMGEKPSTTFIPPEIFTPLGWRSTPGIPYDPARAKQLLAEAGYPNGGTLPGVTYLFRSGLPTSKEMAQLLARQWKQKLNLDIPLENQETKTVRERLNNHDYSICVSDWIGDYNDPSTFTDMYLSNSDNNNCGWISAEYDRLCHDAAKEIDAQKRLRLLEKAEQILNREAPIVGLFVLTNQYMFRDNVHGINLQPRNTVIFKGVYVDK
jgi:oligopeptide transport system substrate-binding protein